RAAKTTRPGPACSSLRRRRGDAETTRDPRHEILGVLARCPESAKARSAPGDELAPAEPAVLREPLRRDRRAGLRHREREQAAAARAIRSLARPRVLPRRRARHALEHGARTVVATQAAPELTGV